MTKKPMFLEEAYCIYETAPLKGCPGLKSYWQYFRDKLCWLSSLSSI